MMGSAKVTSDTSNIMSLAGPEDQISGAQGTLVRVLKSQGTFAKRNLSEEKVQLLLLPVLLSHVRR